MSLSEDFPFFSVHHLTNLPPGSLQHCIAHLVFGVIAASTISLGRCGFWLVNEGRLKINPHETGTMKGGNQENGMIWKPL